MKKIQNNNEKPIVKYDRRFSMNFKSVFALPKIDADLFNTVLSIIHERKSVKTTILAKDIIDRSKYLNKNSGDYTISKLIKSINVMADHVGGMYYLVRDEEKNIDRRLYLFDSFGINKDTGDLEVILGQSFSSYFYNIEKARPFTRYYLDNYLSLKSKYTKALYQLFLDNFGGCTIDLNDLFDLLEIENKSTQRSFINRLPVYIKQVEDTGDFVRPIEYIINKRVGKIRGNRSITFKYKEQPKRITKDIIIENELKKNSQTENLICPYCGDEIEETENRKTKKKFWHHKNWEMHKNCKLPNAENREEMLKLIDVAKQTIKEKEKKQETKKYRELALKELKEKYPNGIEQKNDSENLIPSNEDIERAVNGGFSNNEILKQIEIIKSRQDT